MSKVNGVLFKTNKKITIQTSGISGYSGASAVANIIYASLFVPANTFTLGDVVTLEHGLQVSAGTQTQTWRLYYNTSNSLTGAVQIAQRSESAGLLFLPGMRKMAIRSTTNNTFIMGTTANFYTDFQSVSVVPSILSLNWTVDLYFLVAAISNPDNMRALYFKISN
jgi:hypothetical protein